MTAPMTPAPKTADALHAEAKELRRRIEALRCGIEHIQAQRDVYCEHLAAIESALVLAIEAEGTL